MRLVTLAGNLLPDESFVSLMHIGACCTAAWFCDHDLTPFAAWLLTSVTLTALAANVWLMLEKCCKGCCGSSLGCAICLAICDATSAVTHAAGVGLAHAELLPRRRWKRTRAACSWGEA